MPYFTKDEKKAMMVLITQIGSIQDSRNEARTKIMMRYQDMLDVDTFEMMEYTKQEINNALPTIQPMSDDKKKFYVRMMLALMIEDGRIVESEEQAFLTLVTACRIPNKLIKEAMKETLEQAPHNKQVTMQ